MTVDVEFLNPMFMMTEDNRRLQAMSFLVLVITNLELDGFGSLFTCTFKLQVNQSNSYTIMDSSGYMPAPNLEHLKSDIAEYLVGSSRPSYGPIETPGALSVLSRGDFIGSAQESVLGQRGPEIDSEIRSVKAEQVLTLNMSFTYGSTG